MAEQKDQQHPQYANDRQLVMQLLAVSSNPSDLNLAELGRLRIRYRGFPGARDIQTDLDKILKQWQLNEEELLTKTRQIHSTGQIYRGRGRQEEDWS